MAEHYGEAALLREGRTPFVIRGSTPLSRAFGDELGDDRHRRVAREGHGAVARITALLDAMRPMTFTTCEPPAAHEADVAAAGTVVLTDTSRGPTTAASTSAGGGAGAKAIPATIDASTDAVSAAAICASDEEEGGEKRGVQWTDETTEEQMLVLFKLAASAVKIELSVSFRQIALHPERVNSIDLQQLYHRARREGRPFHEWHSWLRGVFLRSHIERADVTEVLEQFKQPHDLGR